MLERIKKILATKIENQRNLLDDNLFEQLRLAGEKIIKALQSGKKILVCGNGGSAADAQHFVAELVVRFQKERQAFPAIALHTNTSVLTATANDYSFESVFARQVEALGERGDVLVGISTSGEARNVLEAMKTARKKGLLTIGLTGKGDNPLTAAAKFIIHTPGKNTAEIQECHIVILHTLCQIVEEALTTEP